MTPELLPPPPRRVRGKLGGGLWFVRLFTLPHMLVGFFVAAYLVFLLLWWIFGTDVPGTVTRVEVHHSSKHGDSYTLGYRFEINGQTKTSSDGVSYDVYERYQPQKGTNLPVTVHYFSIGFKEHSGLREGGSLWNKIGMLCLWAGFWNAIMSFVFYQIWFKPLQARWLYKYGEATTGKVVRKRASTGKSTTYYVSFSFHDPYSGQPYESEITVWNAGYWQLISEGQAVTILYSRNKPKRSTVYECGGYEVKGDRDA